MSNKTIIWVNTESCSVYRPQVLLVDHPKVLHDKLRTFLLILNGNNITMLPSSLLGVHMDFSLHLYSSITPGGTGGVLSL